MALVDPATDQLVVRIVYDGPAYAGKSTSLRALASSLGSAAFSAGEADGRTLYFDWVDYLGGRFEGMPIRCQIVAVPGQQVLAQRRRLLLETADVVIFVVDSRPAALAENQRAFELLRDVLRPAEPPVAVVAQANKRDLPEALDLDELRAALGDGALAMTEAVADRGEGVRETFVLAVRLALDRVRELWTSRTLPRIAPAIADGASLLAMMQEIEEGRGETLVSVGLGCGDRRLSAGLSITSSGASASGRQETAPASSGAPLAPDATVPSGLVWPPVEGRVMVHEATRVPPQLEQVRRGDWVGTSREWRLRSPRAALFFDLEEGRSALVAWARWHTAAAARLSPRRCLVLARATPDGADEKTADGPCPGWRLWQVVERARSLADDCHELLAQTDDELLGAGLLRVAEQRLRAEHELRAGGWLRRVDLHSVGVSPGGDLSFTRFAPYPAAPPAPTADEGGAALRILRAELAPLLRRELARTPRRLPGVIAALRRSAAALGAGQLGKVLQGLLLES
jgi:signal recognition particle receptor subunit beta